MPEEKPDDLESVRAEKLRRIEALGIDPWGHRFDDHASIASVRSREPEAAQPGAEIPGPRVRVAGRVMLRRVQGNVHFLELRDWTGRIQVFVGKKQVGPEAWALAKELDLSDLLGIDGTLGFTKTGELTVFAESLTFLGKSLLPPPEKWHGLTDVEARSRMRYLDLFSNPESLQTFLGRSKIVSAIRRTLESRGFVEIEGPTMQSIAGGAAARPFTTHHNALDIDLYLRIALELHLKRLLVGGMERVFELGRVYRNEGISRKHNPEFTMMEAYQAYGDYHSMMDLTEAILCGAIDAVDGNYARTIHVGSEGEIAPVTVDFTPPWPRRTYHELVREHAGVDPTDPVAVKAKAESLGLQTAGKDPVVILGELFEESVEDRLTGPVFVIDYPAPLCPLTKRKAGHPEVAERFELFVLGMELANAYTELNDPNLQEQLFRQQLAGLPEDESMAKMDDDFIKALKHAMPPAGGLGIGIDRLCMLLLDRPSIRDVILFPLLRPQGQGSGGG
ncbi:lysine--tRNA ligase [Tautonia plasticadhaerens]|uniref:Lysine--tRNA ligase n=1 Tax=Tautonia plasticadhaerens TaxID=2527974 RepID=A0A518GXT8_9BACT|nr:lysine--tRNA ligase [Tautonia plasticadhaerens]QDV33401.1 Lysine--tRNA ligase [Tautonia plasticadhaerens]